MYGLSTKRFTGEGCKCKPSKESCWRVKQSNNLTLRVVLHYRDADDKLHVTVAFTIKLSFNFLKQWRSPSWADVL